MVKKSISKIRGSFFTIGNRLNEHFINSIFIIYLFIYRDIKIYFSNFCLNTLTCEVVTLEHCLHMFSISVQQDLLSTFKNQ